MTDVPGESQRGDDASAAKRDGRPENAGESTETNETGSPQELCDTPESTGSRESDSDSTDGTNSAERGDELSNAGDSIDSGITNDAELADDVDATTASAQTSDDPTQNTVDTTQPVNLADGVNAEDAPHMAGIPGQDNIGNAEQAPPPDDAPPPSQYPIPPDAGMPPPPGAPPHPGMPVNAATPPYPGMPPQPPPPLLGMPPQSPKPPPPAHWPEPDIAGTPKALLGALISGAGVAIFLPLRSLGIGITLLGLALALGMLVTARANNAKIDPTRVGWTVLALLLLTVPTFRDSQWLYALCLLTACVAGMFAVAAPRKPLEFAMSVGTIPVGAFRSLPWSARGTREARSNSRNGLRLTVSIIVSLVLLVLFGALFSGADTRFADLVSAVIPDFDAESVFRLLILLPLFALAGLGAAFTLLNRPTAEEARGPGRKLRHLEWALPVGVLTVLFLVFVGMQIPALLSGEQLIRSPTDLTYAEYARSGFWQLTAVTILTLPIIGATARWAPQNTRFDRTLLRGLGGALSVLTLVIVVCALVRMSAYQQAYGFTVLRLLVETCEIWIGAVYLMILVAGIRLRARWLPGLVLATGMVTLLGLAAANPEGVITANNIARYQATGKIDAPYLTDMSGDAVPALRAMPDGEDKEFIRSSIREELRAHDDQWRSWNLSRVNARNELSP